jgi:PmbA protein
MELGEIAVRKAIGAGASEAEAYLQRTSEIRVEFAEEIENLKTIESLGIGLRVAIGKKIASYSTSILNESEIGEAAVKAVKIAKVASEDPNWNHMNKKFGKSRAEGYYDEALKSVDYPEITETLVSAIDLIKNYDKRVSPTRGLLGIQTSTISIANSYNENCERKETLIGVWMSARAEDAGMKSTGQENQEARFWKEIKFKDLAVKAAEKAVKSLKAKPIPSQKTSAIIRNQIFANILGVLLSEPISADWVLEGRSPLSNKLGTKIASENVNILDDGLMRGGLRTRPFDDEGHPTQKTPIVEKGTCKNYLYDTYTALKGKAESTGNAQRYNYWSKPQPLPSNLVLKSGTASPEEIIQDTKNGIFIEETIGEWLSNPVSGNLNATVTHGYLIKNGELKEPIKGVVISGNFYELLKSGIETIGNDLRNSMQNYSPTVKLTELTIAGE